MRSASDKRFPKNHSPEVSSEKSNLLMALAEKAKLQSDLIKERAKSTKWRVLYLANKVALNKVLAKQREIAKNSDIPLRKKPWIENLMFWR